MSAGVAVNGQATCAESRATAPEPAAVATSVPVSEPPTAEPEHVS
jgi:hypothetical protein